MTPDTQHSARGGADGDADSGMDVPERDISNERGSTVDVFDDGIFDDAADGNITPLDLDALAEQFVPGGPVNGALGDDYEFREQQQTVAREVGAALNDDAICLLEAPPGTGKTFAYLLPAARWALANDDERVLVSTNTINLQNQIVHEDMPKIQAILGDGDGAALRVSLVKGRGNYLCPRRVRAMREETSQSDLYDGADVAALLAWAARTRDGSKADLDFTPSPSAWARVSADRAGCSREQCRAADCFFFKARKDVAEAQVLVVNHALLFSHLKLGDDAGLPLGRVVIDEAHNVVDVATQCFSVHTSNVDIHATLRQLRVAASHATALAGKHEGEDATALSDAARAIVDADITMLEEETTRVCDHVRDRVASFDSMRIAPADEARWHDTFQECRTLKDGLSNVAKQADAAASALDDAAKDDAGVDGVAWEFKAAKKYLQDHIDAVEQFADGGADVVKSVTVKRAGADVVVELSAAPLHIGPLLQRTLYKQCKTVAMISATLRVDDRFDFHARALGVDGDDQLRTCVVPSPFDHSQQALLAMVTDVPPPTPETDDSRRALAEAVFGVVTAAGGGGLVLFTSKDTMRMVSGMLSPRLAAAGIHPLTQGDESRERLLARFKADTHSVLFATDSFREGVDVAGEALRLVVITKLPFRVPTEPVFEARSEAAGDKAFYAYGVPLAVIDFRQAFGRLIRTTTDRGAVVVLDSRLAAKSYGKRFIRSLPRCRQITGPLATVVNAVETFVRGTPL